MELEACHLSVGELFFHRSGTCMETDERTRGAGHVFGIHGGLSKLKQSRMTNMMKGGGCSPKNLGEISNVRKFVSIPFAKSTFSKQASRQEDSVPLV